MGQTVWYAIRPEKMRLTRAKPEARNSFAVHVIDIAYLGNLSIYKLRLPSGRRINVSLPNLSRHDEDALSWDEAAYVSWDDKAGVVLTR